MAENLVYGLKTMRREEDRQIMTVGICTRDIEWANAMDFIEDVIYLIDLDDRVVQANKAFFELTGLPPEQTIGQEALTPPLPPPLKSGPG